jgi:hypothetical protein
VALPFEKLCEERAGRPRSQYEDPHGAGKTVSQSYGRYGPDECPGSHARVQIARFQTSS